MEQEQVYQLEVMSPASGEMELSLQYVDYELESEDSIYELSENETDEMENNSVIESDNEHYINDWNRYTNNN